MRYQPSSVGRIRAQIRRHSHVSRSSEPLSEPLSRPHSSRDGADTRSHNAPLVACSRGSIGSLSSARTPNTPSCTRRSGSRRMKCSSASIPRANSRWARPRQPASCSAITHRPDAAWTMLRTIRNMSPCFIGRRPRWPASAVACSRWCQRCAVGPQSMKLGRKVEGRRITWRSDPSGRTRYSANSPWSSRRKMIH
jgi:hypothetical protein